MTADPAARIERTAWGIAAALAVASLAWRSAPVTAGVLIGALVAVVNFRFLARFVRALVASGERSVPRARHALHFFKYAVSAAVIVAALKYRIAEPVALLVGASVLLPALFRESLAGTAAPSRKEA